MDPATNPARRWTVRAASAVLPDGAVGPAEVEVDGGRIVAVHPVSGPDDGTVLAPGLVDLQVNGVDDVDCARAAGDDWDRLDRLLAATGVTAWLPTLITGPLDAYAAPLARIETARCRAGPHPAVLGAHLEGPFLGARTGAHPTRHVRDLDLDWLRDLPRTVRLITLGPEQPAAGEAIRLLTGRGIAVSLGHSDADLATTVRAVDAGATMVTHLFNAMAPLHHREPGIAGAALTDDRVAVGLIADLVHVAPAALRIAVRAAGTDRTVLVTDAVAWRAPHLRDLGIDVVEGAPRLPDGTIAGSALTLDAAVRNVVDAAGIAPHRALRSASEVPARVLGLADRGRLVPGARADLVVLDADLAVRRTIVGGEVVHEA